MTFSFLETRAIDFFECVFVSPPSLGVNQLIEVTDVDGWEAVLGLFYIENVYWLFLQHFMPDCVLLELVR